LKKIFFLTAIFAFLNCQVFAQSPADDYQKTPRSKQPPLPSVNTIRVKTAPTHGFFFKPSLSIEYNAPEVSGGGTNTDFKTSDDLFHQLREIENIALGFNFRLHRYLGFNANWVQSDLDNASLQDVGALSRKANFRIDQYNFSALFYVPLVENLFEVFAEGGVSDMTSKLNYANASGVFLERKAHETTGLYGAGFQLTLNENNAIRFSVQKYYGKLALLDSHYSTVRIGYLRSF